MKRLVVLGIVAVALTLAVRTWVIEGIYVATASMEPTLPVGTHLFLEKVSYLFHPPRRGDIVVFPSPVRPGRDLVKRVIGTGGDVIELRDKAVILNGRTLHEPYVQHLRGDEPLVGDDLGPMEVPSGTLFVMGDNRDVSGDSRDWSGDEGGPERFVPVDRVKGRVMMLF